MGMGSDNHWITQLDEEARARRDQRSSHVFAEGEHSDVRGQIHNLEAGGELDIWQDKWPRHLFIVIGIDGVVDAVVEGTRISYAGPPQMAASGRVVQLAASAGLPTRSCLRIPDRMNAQIGQVNTRIVAVNRPCRAPRDRRLLSARAVQVKGLNPQGFGVADP